MLLIGRRVLGAVAAAFMAGTALAGPAAAETVLKISLHSDLKIVDPIWTTALITTHHGNMIYDTLFATDDKLQIKPQMVDTWKVSDQKLMADVAELSAPDAKTIKMVLKEPYGLVLDTLGKPSANFPFMMPKRVAE